MGKDQKAKNKRAITRRDRDKVYGNRGAPKLSRLFDPPSTSDEDAPTASQMAEKIFRPLGEKSKPRSQSVSDLEGAAGRKNKRKSPTRRTRGAVRSRSPAGRKNSGKTQEKSTQTDSESDKDREVNSHAISASEMSDEGAGYMKNGPKSVSSASEPEFEGGYMGQGLPSGDDASSGTRSPSPTFRSRLARASSPRAQAPTSSGSPKPTS